MRTEEPIPPEPISHRRLELAMFLLLAVFVWPLISVILVSAVLTLLVIPVLYHRLLSRRGARAV